MCLGVSVFLSSVIKFAIMSPTGLLVGCVSAASQVCLPPKHPTGGAELSSPPGHRQPTAGHNRQDGERHNGGAEPRSPPLACHCTTKQNDLMEATTSVLHRIDDTHHPAPATQRRRRSGALLPASQHHQPDNVPKHHDTLRNGQRRSGATLPANNANHNDGAEPCSPSVSLPKPHCNRCAVFCAGTAPTTGHRPCAACDTVAIAYTALLAN